MVGKQKQVYVWHARKSLPFANPYGGSVILQMDYSDNNNTKCSQAESAVVGSGFKLAGVDCNGNDPLQKFRWTPGNKIKLIDYPDKDL
jgi:hypothetical protein